MQQTRASLTFRYSADAQRFTPTGDSPQFDSGVAMTGGFSFEISGGTSIFSRVLLPQNADYDTGSGSGDEGFKFSGFPALENSAGDPILDINGQALDFTALTVLGFHIRAIDPDQPWGGTVKITTSGSVVPGDAFGAEGIGAEAFLFHSRADEWAPGGSGEMIIEFVPTTAPTAQLVNAMVELIIIGGMTTPAIPEFTAVPTISGSTSDGDILTAATGTITGSPTPATGYQWLRYNVGGTTLVATLSTGPTYTLVTADIGYTIRVRQDAANSEGSNSALSAATAVIT